MPDNATLELDVARRLSIQEEEKSAEPQSTTLMNIFVRAGETIPPWWSRARDFELRRKWQQCDYISGTFYSLISRLTTLPRQIVPKDPSIRKHRDQADERLHNLETVSEYGEGWMVFYAKFLIDFLTQDNGAFAEVIGGGRPDGPIIGWPVGLANLDSARCQRTTNPEFPVFYTDKFGDKYKLHHTRVIRRASMPSAMATMNGVGFSALSRIINVGQVLVDILQYKQEKMGSRPPRAIITGSYISTQDLLKAVHDANIQMNNAQLERFSKIVMVGNPNKEIKLDIHDLASIPDGFNEKDSVQIGMCAIALGCGVDLREIWPATITGATKADAEVMHSKARGKFFSEMLSMTTADINSKFLPPYLELLLDYQDDEQDQQQATIRLTKAQGYEKNLTDKAMTVRAVREKMLEGGEISDLQFEMMELADGRLSDGQSVLSLFLSTDPDVKEMLAVKIDKPLKTRDNDPNTSISAIDDQLWIAQKAYMETPRESMKSVIRRSIGALEYLKKQYIDLAEQKRQQDAQVAWQAIEGKRNAPMPDANNPEQGDAADVPDRSSGNLQAPKFPQPKVDPRGNPQGKPQNSGEGRQVAKKPV